LLMLETSVADKVPALISTGSYADAIAVATSARYVQTGNEESLYLKFVCYLFFVKVVICSSRSIRSFSFRDADFIFSTLMEYERMCMSSATAADVSKAQATFLSTVVSKFTPEAFNMLRRYLSTTADVKSVTNLLLRAQKFTDAGSAMALRAVGESDFREKQGILAEASRVFGLGKETALYKSCTDDYLELLKDQEVVRTKYGTNEVAPENSSVTGTISALLKFAASNIREQHRLLTDADKIAKKFRVSEKRLWHIKVKAFADSEQWSNLRILADSKKSPIGYKPFARVAIRGKQSIEEVMRYIDRVTVPEERYDLFCEAGFWKNALEEAARMRDVGRLLSVKTLCNSPELQLQADQMMARLA
jgi:vacuolar protein sorting-associated protein 16